jgi:hypothetical protein
MKKNLQSINDWHKCQVKEKVNFILEQAMKAKRGGGGE